MPSRAGLACERGGVAHRTALRPCRPCGSVARTNSHQAARPTMPSDPPPSVTKPWRPVALARHLWGQAGLTWGWVVRGFPLRPADWETAGVGGASREESEAYAHWYHSSLRAIVQMIAEFPI